MHAKQVFRVNLKEDKTLVHFSVVHVKRKRLVLEVQL